MTHKPEAPYAYVKNYYGVPANIGARVKMSGRRPTEEGVIVRKRQYDHYVHVRFDGQSFDVPVHPLELDYGATCPAPEAQTLATIIYDPVAGTVEYESHITPKPKEEANG